MFATLDELVNYLQQTLPQAKSIANLKIDERVGIITFAWNGHSFAIKKTLETFELKAEKVFLTGASILMQSALMKRSKNEKVIESVIDAIQQAEDLIMSKQEQENGLKLLGAVKGTLNKLAGKAI
jgi:hypothetical protein